MSLSVTERSKHNACRKSTNSFYHGQTRSKIVVVGSLHMDLTVKAERIPRIGETVLGKDFVMSPGGKGANQAVAAAKLGADVTLVGRVGADILGRELIKKTGKSGVDTNYIIEDKTRSTGVALIMVDKTGNNVIAVASGADMGCCEQDIDRAEEVIKSSDIVLLQMEIPLSVVKYAVDKAFEQNISVILNPAPAQQLADELLRKIYVLTPNEKEAETLSNVAVTDLASAKTVAKTILKRGPENVIITLGKDGAIMATKAETAHIEGMKVNAVDATGAGDAFCGALAVAISSRMSLKEAAVYSNCAGALATTKIGAQEALPTAEELRKFMKSRRLI